MAPYSMAGLLSCALERILAMWSGSYHRTTGTSRFILSTGNALIDRVNREQTGRRIRRRPRLGGLLNYDERAV